VRPTITKPNQVKALIAPMRQEIVDALETGGPCSVSELAAMLQRPADGLYHHLRVLSRVGLVREVSRSRQGRHVFVVYDVAKRPLVMSYRTPVRAGDVGQVVAASQRLSLRDFRRALAAGLGPVHGENRVVWAARVRGWLTPAQVRELNELLSRALALVRSADAPPMDAAKRRAISVQFVLTPTGIGGRRKSGGKRGTA
jgi:DNA-binding transcriptional ArsR family regulator